MAERVPIPSEAAKCNWNSDGVTYPSTDPGAPKRLTGFQPKDVPVPGPGEAIPANDHNWLWKTIMEMTSWSRDFITREWRDVHEGISQTTSAALIFRVVPPLGAPFANYARYQTGWSAASTAATGGNPTEVKTDGEQIYYIAGSVAQSLIAASPVAGAEIWESGVVIQFGSVAVDGAAVYTFSTNAGEPGLFILDRTTGTQTGNTGAEYACTKSVSNGVYCCGVNGTVGGAGSLVFYLIATPLETGTVIPLAAAINGLAIDNDQVYVGGTRNVNDVFAYTLSSRASAWSTTLPTTIAPTVNSIAADGDCVYVATDNVALTAGGNASIFCLERVSGAVLWTMDLFNIDILSIDDRYLHAVRDNNTVYMIKLRAPVPSVVASVTGFGLLSIDSDGYALYGSDSGTPANFRKVWVGGAAKTYQITGVNDPNRRPFHKMAVPVDGRI
jgi:hypothetical protein